MLSLWCKDRNLDLNVSKSKEMVVAIRRERHRSLYRPLRINGTPVETVSSYRVFHGPHTSPTWWRRQGSSCIISGGRGSSGSAQPRRNPSTPPQYSLCSLEISLPGYETIGQERPSVLSAGHLRQASTSALFFFFFEINS